MAQSRRNYAVRKEITKRRLFDSFARVFFLVGTETDWLPTSSSSGPLVDLTESIFKSSFLLSQYNRSNKLHLIFFGGDPDDVEEIKERISTRDASITEGPTSRVKVFRGRRLPLLENYSLEVDQVKVMLQEADNLGALKSSSVESAFSECIKVIKGYVFVNSRRAYVGYPRLKQSNRSSSTDQEPNQTSRSSPNGGTSALETNQQLAPRTADAVTTTAEQSPQEDRESTGAEGSVTNSGAETPNPLLAEACRLLQAAQDDYAYMIVSLLFDEESQANIDFFAAAYVEVSKSNTVVVDALMQDVLTYSHWKWCKIKNRREHEEREKRLKATAEIFEIARESYGLKLYRDMGWLHSRPL